MSAEQILLSRLAAIGALYDALDFAHTNFENKMEQDCITKDEYANLATLESRLQVFIERLSLSNHNQQFSHINSSSSIGTMIPTPGMPQSGNNSLMGTAAIDNQMLSGNVGNGITSSTVNSGPFLPASNGLSSVAAQGTLDNGHQQPPSNFSISSGGNNMVTSLGGQRLASQMIPTPGFNSTNSDTANNGPNNQTYVNLESSNIMGTFSSVESNVVSQPQQHKHHGGHNSRILHSLGSHMGGGMRSGLQQKSYASSNGTLNGALGMMANNLHMMNGPGASEGYLTGTMYGNPSRSLQPTFDHNQQTLIQGDGYTISTADSSGSGNLYAPATSVGSVMNNQNINAITMQSMPKTNSQLMSTQSNLSNSQQVASLKSHSIDQAEKNFQSQHALAENRVRSHLPQFSQQSHKFPQTHLVQQRRQRQRQQRQRQQQQQQRQQRQQQQQQRQQRRCSESVYICSSKIDVVISSVNMQIRRHVNLDPSQREYWNWTWDDLVVHDLPAIIGFIYI